MKRLGVVEFASYTNGTLTVTASVFKKKDISSFADACLVRIYLDSKNPKLNRVSLIPRKTFLDGVRDERGKR